MCKLFQLHHKTNISFPVGKINRMTLYPMSFREFVIACGYENYISILSSWSTDREIPDLYHVPMTKLLKEYFIVGGMPEAVLEWTTSRDFSAVEAIQEEILSDYADDFSKHAPVTEIPKDRCRCRAHVLPTQGRTARQDRKNRKTSRSAVDILRISIAVNPSMDRIKECLRYRACGSRFSIFP